MPVCRVAFAAAGLLLAAGLLWPRATPVLPPRELVPEAAYAIETSGEATEFDLAFAPSQRHLLIVGSLGEAAGCYRVTVVAHPIDAVERQPVRVLGPFRPHPVRGPSVRRRLPGPASASPQRADASETRTFHLHVTDGPLEDPKQYAAVSSRVVAEGRAIRIYLDSRMPVEALRPGVPEEIVACFDERLLPGVRETLGDVRDVDGDGKFAVLLTPWLGRLQGGRTSLGGFVRPSDFRADVPRPLSNRCDMLYLNTSVHPEPRLQTLLAHELAHAVCFSARMPSASGRAPDDQDDWLSEAIAHLAENLHGDGWSNLDYRISRFLSEPQRAPLVVRDYYRSGLWRDHGCRGATYLFLRWCVDQYGDGLLPALIASPDAGTRAIERATGERFEELFRRWSVALAQSGPFFPPLPLGVPLGTGRGEGEPPASIGSGNRSPVEQTPGHFISLNLHRPLGRFALAGPRRLPCDLDAGPLTFESQGTALCFVELGAQSAGVRRVRITADRGARLQLTLIPQAPDWPHVEFAARLAPVESDGAAARHVELHMTADRPDITVEAIACEQNSGETKESLVLTGDAIDAHQTHTVQHAGRLTEHRYRTPLPDSWSREIPVVVKLVARDREGRRAAAWSQLSPARANARN